MPLIQTSAERTPHDLSHLCFSAGRIGRLKTIGFHNVLPGDSFQTNLVGAMRLSPLRRGLAMDVNTQIFSFYIPYRMIYGLEKWRQFLLDGGKVGSATLPDFAGSGVDDYRWTANFLGTIPNRNGSVPLWLYRSYELIYNNYFKHPQGVGLTYNSFSEIPDEYRRDGFPCNHLPTIWSTLAIDGVIDATNPEGGLDDTNGLTIDDINSAATKIHLAEERAHFMQRYRDIMQSFGGHATPDAEARPTLLMHSDFWSSGFDVNGTDQTTLGSFSGRVQQSFNHRVPRFYVPEHGVIMHLVLNRFPPIHVDERNFMISPQASTYQVLAGDPTITANAPHYPMAMNDLFFAGSEGVVQVPHGSWYRWQPNYVDNYYTQAEGFPFTSGPMPANDSAGRIDPDVYDQIFQNMTLAHWSVQCKFNTIIMRSLPSAREALLTAV